jgi:hypothetical protein
MHADVLDAHFGQGLHRRIADRVLSQPDVAKAVKAKQSAGGTIQQILTIIGQYALTYLTTGTINWAALIAAIEAILVPAA